MKILLKDKNLHQTPFRKEVLAIFAKHGNAIPVSVLERELKVYNRITLYRTIKTFVSKGVIHEITISGEPSNYALCKEACDTHTHHHQHVHFKCIKCTNIFCVEMDNFPQISLAGYQINQLEIQASGICKKCR